MKDHTQSLNHMTIDFTKNQCHNTFMPKQKPSRAEKPRGFWGTIAAWLMGIGHRSVYKSVAASLDLKPEDDLLDVGCGSGIFIKKFASKIHHVAGLDHSEDMVKLASRNNNERVQKGTAEFKLGDAAKLPWKNESFSAVSVIETFYWLKPLETLKEIYRVLRSGGRLAVGLGFNADDGKDHTRYTKVHGMRFYSGKEMKAMFKEAGFSESSITYSKGFGMPKIMTARAVK